MGTFLAIPAINKRAGIQANKNPKNRFSIIFI